MASEATKRDTQSPLRWADDPLVKEVQCEFVRLDDQLNEERIPDIVVKHFFNEMLQDGVIKELGQVDDQSASESAYECPGGDLLRDRIIDRFRIEVE